MAKSPTIQPKSLDEIVREVGTYAPEAFEFVRDGLTTASEKVHGAVSGPQRKLFEWMSKKNLTVEALQQLGDEGGLPPKVRNLVAKAGGIEALNRHVTGRELCLALRGVALERWGLLARTVLEHWGVYRTDDFGRIVFALVDNQVLSKQPSDAIHDFERVYDFDDAFPRVCRVTLDEGP